MNIKYVVFIDFEPAPDIEYFDTYEEALKEAEHAVTYRKCTHYIAKVEKIIREA